MPPAMGTPGVWENVTFPEMDWALFMGSGGFGVGNIVTDPARPTDMYVGGYGSIWKSTDYGLTWKKIDSKPNPPSLALGHVLAVAGTTPATFGWRTSSAKTRLQVHRRRPHLRADGRDPGAAGRGEPLLHRRRSRTIRPTSSRASTSRTRCSRFHGRWRYVEVRVRERLALGRQVLVSLLPGHGRCGDHQTDVVRDRAGRRIPR